MASKSNTMGKLMIKGVKRRQDENRERERHNGTKVKKGGKHLKITEIIRKPIKLDIPYVSLTLLYKIEKSTRTQVLCIGKFHASS